MLNPVLIQIGPGKVGQTLQVIDADDGRIGRDLVQHSGHCSGNRNSGGPRGRRKGDDKGGMIGRSVAVWVPACVRQAQAGLKRALTMGRKEPWGQTAEHVQAQAKDSEQGEVGNRGRRGQVRSVVRQIESSRVASLCQYLSRILGRVLTVPAARSHIKNGAVNSVRD